MVLFHHIIEILALTQTNPPRQDAFGFQCCYRGRKGRVLVHVDDAWHGIAGRAQSLTKEAFGSSRVALRREQKINRLAVGVYRAVQIFVFPLDLYICLVGAIALVGGFQMRPAALVQLGCIGLHPAPDASRVHGNAAFRQKLRHVLVGERISEGTSGRKGGSPRQGNVAI